MQNIALWEKNDMSTAWNNEDDVTSKMINGTTHSHRLHLQTLQLVYHENQWINVTRKIYTLAVKKMSSSNMYS